MTESGLGEAICTEPSANPTANSASPSGQLICVTDTGEITGRISGTDNVVTKGWCIQGTGRDKMGQRG